VDEGEEGAHVEASEHEGAPPPHAAGHLGANRQKYEACGNCPDDGSPERGICRQVEIGEVVRRTPGDGGDGSKEGPSHIVVHWSNNSLPGSYYESMAEASDHVSRIQLEWQRERPDLDVSPLGVIGRLHR